MSDCVLKKKKKKHLMTMIINMLSLMMLVSLRQCLQPVYMLEKNKNKKNHLWF